ncbi:MAG: MFS transporter [Oscillospiraceae bacterium]
MCPAVWRWFFLASRIQSIGMLFLSYGLFVGLAIGMVFNGVLSTVVFHFTRQSSMITALLLVGFGLGGMVLSTACSALMAQWGWRFTFLLLGGLFVVLTLLGALVITAPPSLRSVKAHTFEGTQVTTGKMLRRPAYLLIFFWCTALSSSCLVLFGHAALCSADIGASPFVAALSSGVVSLFNVVARLVVGGVQQRIGKTKTAYMLTFIGIGSSLICLLGYRLYYMPLLLLGYALLGFLNGGCTIWLNTYIMETYGKEHFGMNMAVTNVHLAIASILGPAVAGYIKTAFGSYTYAFFVMIALSLLSLVLLAVKVKITGKKQNAV